MKFLKICLSLSAFLLSSKVQALSLHWMGYGEIPYDLKYEKNAVGGLSGLANEGGKLVAVSDDRGSKGPPRFYELQISRGTPWKITLQKVRVLSGVPSSEKGPLLDLEGVALFGKNLILSSEGDNNAKPREMPRLFMTDLEGKWQRDLTLPEKFLPESTDRQTKGIQNNAAFEGLACSAGCSRLYAMTERALAQDVDPDNEDLAHPVRLITWLREGDDFKVLQENIYHLDDYATDEAGKEVMRGVSEILPYNDQQLLVLERGLNISGRGLSYRAALYLVELEGATDVSRLNSIRGTKYTAMKKKKIFDFSEIQDKLPEKQIQNFEAMAFWQSPKGERFLLVLSDNNFSKREKTVLVALKIIP